MFTTTSNAREDIIAGVLESAEVICSTQGVGKSTVAVSHPNAMPFPSPDGAIIASNLKPEDRRRRIGSDWLIQAARRTAKQAGDGTTKTAALAAEILGRFPRTMKRRDLISQLAEAAEFAQNRVLDAAIPIGSKSDLFNVATISANNSPELGEIVSDIVWEVGEHGTVYVEDRSDENRITSEVKKGYVLRPGLASEKFGTGQFHNPLVCLIDEHVYDQKSLKRVYDRFHQECYTETGYDRSLVIFTSKCDGDALNSAVMSYAQRRVPVIIVNIHGLWRSDVFEDLANISGAPIWSEATGNPLSKFKGQGFGRKDVFGQIDKISFDGDQVTVFGAASDNYIADVMEKSYDGDRESQRKERVSKMKNGVGYIYIGGNSTAGMTNVGQLIDDAQEACFSALRHGYIPGGASVELSVANDLDVMNTIGSKLLARAIRESFKNMLRNSEYKVSWGRWKNYVKTGYVFNMKTGKFEPHGETSVLDSVKAVERAIANAVAVATDVIQVEKAIIWEE